MNPFGVLILAAGDSSRMGQPKQLLLYQGETLIEHVVSTALGSGAKEILVIVGAHAAEVRPLIVGRNIKFVDNSQWEEGMGSSVSVGIQSIGDDIAAVVILLVDQPYVTSAQIALLANGLTTTTPIVASSYDGVLGVPCAFARSEFESLRNLSGDNGARWHIRNQPSRVKAVPFEKGGFDVDTFEQYRHLLEK